jgi:RimJ/RimL family protein N-acetyltransferase
MIQGKYVTLRMAKTNERKLIYEMALSTELYKDVWDNLADFEDEYTERYYDMSEPTICGCMLIFLGERPIGFTIYDQNSYEDGWIHTGVMTISDICMYGEGYCGKGYGSDATETLMKHLHEQYAIHTFFTHIHKWNPRSVRAAEKAGFIQVNDCDKLSIHQRIFTPKAMSSPLFGDTYLSDDEVLMLCEYSHKNQTLSTQKAGEIPCAE